MRLGLITLVVCAWATSAQGSVLRISENHPNPGTIFVQLLRPLNSESPQVEIIHDSSFQDLNCESSPILGEILEGTNQTLSLTGLASGETRHFGIKATYTPQVGPSFVRCLKHPGDFGSARGLSCESGYRLQRLQTVAFDNTHPWLGRVGVADDLNNDGETDLLLSSKIDRTYGLYSGVIDTGSLEDFLFSSAWSVTSSAWEEFTVFMGFSMVAISDTSADGAKDIAVSIQGEFGVGPTPSYVMVQDSSNGSEIRRYNAPLNPNPPSTYSNDFGWDVVNLGDLNGNGSDEIAVSDLTSDKIHFFDTATTMPLQAMGVQDGSGESLASGLMGADGSSEMHLLVGNPLAKEAKLYKAANAVGTEVLELVHTFSDPVGVDLLNYGESVLIGDFTGDGVADIAVGSASASHIDLYDGNNLNQVMRTITGVETGNRVGEEMTLADMDGDGYDDLVLGGRNHVSVYSGKRDEILVAHVQFDAYGMNVLNLTDQTRDLRDEIFVHVKGQGAQPAQNEILQLECL